MRLDPFGPIAIEPESRGKPTPLTIHVADNATYITEICPPYCWKSHLFRDGLAEDTFGFDQQHRDENDESDGILVRR